MSVKIVSNPDSGEGVGVSVLSGGVGCGDIVGEGVVVSEGSGVGSGVGVGVGVGSGVGSAVGVGGGVGDGVG